MKKGVIAILIIIELFAEIIAAGAVVFSRDAEKDMDAFCALLADKYGVSQTVHVQSGHGDSEPAWNGQPKGAYIYTGFVDGGIVKDVVILEEGTPFAEHTLEVAQALSKKVDVLVCIACILGIVSVVISLFLIVALVLVRWVH